jgi:hypothetical protein
VTPDTAGSTAAGTGSGTTQTPTSTSASGGGSGTGSTPAPAIPCGTDGTAPDPASMPGSGPSPPTSLAGRTVSITIGADGASFAVDGVAVRAAAPLTIDAGPIAVVGGPGAAWSWDGGAGTIVGSGLSVTFRNATSLTAGGASDTLTGPAADSTWNVTGAGSGSVGGLTFAGYEHLVGARDNKDTFVFAQAGSAASIDGGAGGFDSVKLEGSSRGVAYTATGPQSGTIDRDGDALRYDGLYPIDSRSTSGGAIVNVVDPSSVIVRADGSDLVVEIDPGEDIFFTAASLTSLPINGSSGDDTITISSLGGFAGTFAIDGAGGTDLIDTPRDAGSIALPATTVANVERYSISFLRDYLGQLGVTYTGATVITHGFQPPVVGNGDSLLPLAEAIRDYSGGWLVDYEMLQGGIDFVDVAQSTLPSATGSGELVVLYDWAEESNEAAPGWGGAAADALFALLVDLHVVTPALGASSTVPLHFIGHSFGTAVTSAVVERLAAFDVPVDQVTYLDPHDFDQSLLPVDESMHLYDLGLPAGYGAAVWDNVGFADVYYQTRGTMPGPDVLVPEGRPIPGAYNVWLDGNDLPTSDSVNDHSWVWNGFYLATVLGHLPNGTPDSVDGVDYASGFAFSRLAGGQATRPAPKFYGSDQDHEHSVSAIVNSDGTANSAGLAELHLTASDITNAHWAPQWNPYTVANGDFETPARWNLVSDIQPGWSDHGGGGDGDVDRSGGNHYLALSSGDETRTHNVFYVPAAADWVVFRYKVTDASSDDSLVVSMSGTPLGTFAVTSTTSSWQIVRLAIPASLRNEVQTLTFELTDGSGGLDSAVSVDSVQLADDTSATTVTADDTTALTGGLQSIVTALTGIDTDGLANVVLPFVDSTLGSVVEFLTELQQVHDDLQAAFSGITTDSTISSILDALLANDNVQALTPLVSGGQFTLGLGFRTEVDLSKALDLGTTAAASFGLTLNANATLTASAQVDVLLGVDLSTQTFYIKRGVLHLDATVGVDGLNAGLDLGFLSAQVTGGSVRLTAAVTVTIVDPNDDDGVVTGTELASASALADVFKLTSTGTLDVSLPLTVTIADYTLPSNPAVYANAADVFAGGAPDITFDPGLSTTRTIVAAPAIDLPAGELVTVGFDLTGTDPLTVGASGFGLSVTAGRATIALLRATGVGDTARWTAVKATGLGGSLTLGDFFSAGVSNVSVIVNTATGSFTDGSSAVVTAAPLDWQTAFASPLTVAGIAVDPAAGDHVSGTVDTLSIADLIDGHATQFTIDHSSVTGPLGLSGASLLAVTLTGVAANVGISGYGVAVGGSLAVASLAGDTRTWLAVVGSGLSTTVSLAPVTATLASVALKVNHGTGAAAIQDWTTVGAPATFQFAVSGELAEISGTVSALDVAGVASGSAASFRLTQSQLTNAGLSLTDADLLLLTIDDLVGTIGGSGYGVTVSGDLTIAALTPTDGNNRRWIAAHGTSLSLDVELAPLTIAASGVTFDLNRATNTTAFADWTPYGVALTFPQSGDYLHLAGSVDTISIDGFATVTATTVDLERADGVTTPVGTGTLFTLSLADASLDAGTADSTLTIAGAALAAYSLSVASDTWLALTGSGFAVDATLGPLTLHAASGSFDYNSRSTGADALTDWSTFVAGGPTFASADYFHLAATGGITIAVSGFGSVSAASFDLTRAGSIAGPSGTGTGTLFRLHLTGASLDAGTVELTLTIDNGTLDAYAFAAGGDSWLAIQGDSFDVDLALGPLTLSAGDTSFDYNSGSSATPITNWTFAQGPSSIEAGLFHLAATAGVTMGLTGFASASVATFDLTRQTGVTGPGTTGVGTLLTLSLTGVTFDAGSAGASLTLTGGGLDLYAFAVGASSWTAMSGTGFDIALTAGSLTATADDAAFEFNTQSDPLDDPITNWNFARGPPSLDANLFRLSATSGVTLSVTGLGSISAGTLVLSRESGVTVGGNTGSLFTLSLSTVHLAIDADGASLTVDGASLTVASFTTTVPGGNALYVAGSGLSLAGSVGSVTVTASGVSFVYNPSAVTDWSAVGASTVTAGLFRLSGAGATVDVDGLGSVSVGGFTIGRQSGVTVGGNSGSLFTLSLSTIHLGIDVDAASLTVDGASLTVASFTTTVASGNALYVAGTGFDLAGSVGPVTVTASGVAFVYNPGSVTDWSLVGAGTVTAGLFRLSGAGASVMVEGLGSITVGGFTISRQRGVTVGGNGGSLFTLSLSTVQLAIDADGAALTLDGSSLTVGSFTTTVASGNALYIAGSGFDLAGSVGPVTVTASSVAFVYNPSTVTDWSAAGVTGTVTAGLFRLSGAGATVDVDGIGRESGGDIE